MTELERLNKITPTIIGAAIQVHRALGPGLLECAYAACLAHELGKRGLAVEQQKPVPLVYEDL
jgi:GxxExxY protein